MMRNKDLYNLILFGAGRYVKSYIQLIRFLGDDIAFIVDNDINKQGRYIDGIKIVSPDILIDTDNPIMISCLAFDEIRLLLGELGVESRELYIEGYLNDKKDDTGSIETESFNNLIFDLYSGSKWGGAENWNVVLAEQIFNRKSKYNISLISDEFVEVDREIDVPVTSFSEQDDLKLIETHMLKRDGNIFVNSFFGKSFFAALALKVMQPSKIKIVIVVHNDFKDLYKLCILFEKYVDAYICVSSRIKERLVSEYNICENKVYYLSQPISYDRTFSIEDKEARKVIQIGIAGRLVKPQKRCDLIPEIIDRLEHLNINYSLHIAGDGELLEYISDYVKKSGLDDKVTIYGKVPNNEMSKFWKKMDIYLNFSEFEGTSLSMLEAMSYCCVPIVSNVSGVSDFVLNEINGYVYDFGALDEMCKRILSLENNRVLMKKMGQLSRENIIEKSNMDKYVDKFLSIIQKIALESE